MADISMFPNHHPALREALKPLFHLLEQQEYEGTTVVVKVTGADVYRTSNITSVANIDLVEKCRKDDPEFFDRLFQHFAAVIPQGDDIADQLAAIGLIYPGTEVFGVGDGKIVPI